MPGLENDEDETLDADETPTLEHELPSQPCSMTHVQQVTQIPSVSSTYEGWVMLKIGALFYFIICTYRTCHLFTGKITVSGRGQVQTGKL